MGLLSKIASVFRGGGTATPVKPAQKVATKGPISSPQLNRRDTRPRSGEAPRGGNRSRSAKPRGMAPNAGANEGAVEAVRARPAINPRLAARGGDATIPRSERQGPEGMASVRNSARREGGNRYGSRGARPQRDGDSRSTGMVRGGEAPRHTPRDASRPGGAFTAAELKAHAEAHAAWDPMSYVVPEAEGKKRFADLGLPNELLHAVADLGFQYCTPIQAQSLEFAFAGKNVAGRAQTGTGKTAAFLIAILTRYLRTPEKRNLKPGTPRALVLAPTRELVIQICKDAEAIGRYCGDVRSLAVYGGMDYDRQRDELADEPVDLLVATPGRLLDFVRNRVVDLRQVDTLVIDEADRMLDMGFIPDVRAIVNHLPAREARCTMLYSATLNETVMRLASMWMQEPVRVEIEADSLATDTVEQIVYIARADDKFKLLYNQLAKFVDARTLIFCNRKSTTERVCENLRRYGISCDMLSGDVNQLRRLQILDAFRAGTIRTVVATDVAGRGIHVDDIAYVVNFDFPYEPEDYVHRIGRTGRAGHTGVAISFADEDESFIIPEIEKYINEPLKCVQPEEWMFADLPGATVPRGRPRKNACRIADMRPSEERRAFLEEGRPRPAAPVASVEAPLSDAAAVSETAVVTPLEPALSVASVPVENVVAEPAPPVAEPPVAEPAPVVEPPVVSSAEVTPAIEPLPPVQPPVAPLPEKISAPIVSEPVVAPVVPPKTEVRAPKMKPRVARPTSRPVEVGRPPRREKPVAQRLNRTQADGPRDGSESHHAAAIQSRPIYAQGSHGAVNDEWSPGQK
ncbi:MAG: DEAD/DEAH box helicase [Kiritimatiellia bacterium]